MPATIALGMEASELDEFLDGQRTNVFAVADRKSDYAVPVFFAFQVDMSNYGFRLGCGGG